MPLYELKCRDCDHDWEVRLEWKADLPACPACASANVRKVLQPAALVFKGSGWHVNDYGKNGSKKAANGVGKTSETKETAEPAAKTETKTDTKTDTKSGTATPTAAPVAK
jgi:putative FmdB family regulatory protein